jgi:hypothetical protein
MWEIKNGVLVRIWSDHGPFCLIWNFYYQIWIRIKLR